MRSGTPQSTNSQPLSQTPMSMGGSSIPPGSSRSRLDKRRYVQQLMVLLLDRHPLGLHCTLPGLFSRLVADGRLSDVLKQHRDTREAS